MAMQCLSTKIEEIYVEKVKSSQQIAKEYLLLNRNKNVLVVSKSMTAGIGREGNSWYAPEGGLWFTAGVQLPDYVANLTIFIGIIIHKTLNKIIPNKNFEIKWPNDIYLNSKKICGIITSYESNIDRFLIGVGVDTNVREFPDNLKEIATSIYNEAKQLVDNKEVVEIFWNEFNSNYNSFRQKGLSDFLSYYRRFDFLRDKKLRVDCAGKSSTGFYKDINNDGSITLIENCKSRNIIAGSITILED